MTRRRMGLVVMGWCIPIGAGVTLLAAGADTSLVDAAQQRNLSTVRQALQSGVGANAKRPDGTSALHWAAHWDDAPIADLLIGAGADANAADDHGVTPLQLASENGSAAMVNRLLSAGANPSATRKNGVTPLLLASRAGNASVVKTLLDRGAPVDAAVTQSGQTPLMFAVAERHHDVMRTLIGAGASVHARSRNGFTPLSFVARNGDIDAGKILLAAGADVNEGRAVQTHTLPLAIVSGRDDLALFLLENGADPNGVLYGVSALHAAAGNVSVWLRTWLRERGVDHQRSLNGLSPERRLTLARALLMKGANPNIRITTSTAQAFYLTPRLGAFDTYATGTGDLQDATPLWVASFIASPEMIRVLLAAGADPGLSTKDQTTPLMVASGLGRSTYQPGKKRGDPLPDAVESVKVLIEAGADVNARNEGGFTALHGAAYRGLNEVIEYLARHGANLNVQDFRERTPFRIAEGAKQGFTFQDWPETAELLRQLGADTTLGVSGRVLERQRGGGEDAATVEPVSRD